MLVTWMSLCGAIVAPSKSTLYDVPISNHGARVRLVLYKKQLESAVQVVSPSALGGLGSDAYRALNPLRKMPVLVEDGQAIFESDAICRHLLVKHANAPGPSFFPQDLSARTRAEMLCRLHDAYIGPIQGCLYRDAAKNPFGQFGTRAEAIRKLRAQLAIAEDLADVKGPYLTGEEISLADATLFPTMVFITKMLPKFEEVSQFAMPRPLLCSGSTRQDEIVLSQHLPTTLSFPILCGLVPHF